MIRFLPVLLHQCTGMFFGIISIKIVSRFVQPSTYGTYALFLTLTQLGVLLTHSGISNNATRYWVGAGEFQGAYGRFLFNRSIRQIVPLALLLGCLTTALSLVSGEVLWMWLFPFLLITNFGLALFGVVTGILTAANQQWTLFWMGLLGSLARTFLPVAALFLFNVSAMSLALGFTVHSVVLAVTALILFRWVGMAPQASSVDMSRWQAQLLSYGRPYILMGIGGWLLQSADRWVVLQCFGEERAGFFALASNLGGVFPAMVGTAVMQWAFPRAFKMADNALADGDWRRLWSYCDKMTIVVGLTSLASVVLLWASAPAFTGWLLDLKYAPAINLIVPTGMVALTVQINQFYYLILQGRHDSASMVKVMIVLAVVKTGGSLLAALVSWKIFTNCLLLFPLINVVIGRALIRRIARPTVLPPPSIPVTI